jgi:multiple sugar transport system ATP-binding protein
MGTRVAVLRDGRLQQVDTPQRLYDEPVNQFVATFIGSPAMNLLAATVEPPADDELGGWTLRVGSQRLALDETVVAAHPALRSLGGGPVALGIRPESFSDEPGAPAERVIEATVDLVESLGSETVVHVVLADPPADDPDASDSWRQVVARRGRGVVRLGPHRGLAPGDVVKLAVDTSRVHLFDATSGLSMRGGASEHQDDDGG